MTTQAQSLPLDVAETMALFARARAGGDHAPLSQALATSTLSSWGPLDRALRAVTVGVDELRFSRPSFASLALSSMTRSGVYALGRHQRPRRS